MDRKYKHFNHEAIFKASQESVLEAARGVVADSFEIIEEKAGGFVARGYSAWHVTIVTFRITLTPDGTRLAIEMLVERAAMRGFMLFDIGGYYTGQIDKWFSGITQRLGGIQEQILVSKTTSGVKFQRGCLFGCLAYLIVGACLGVVAIALDRALFPQISGSTPGPLSIMTSVIGLFVGILAYLYVANPDSSTSKFIKEWLQSIQNKEKKE